MYLNLLNLKVNNYSKEQLFLDYTDLFHFDDI